MDELPKGKSLSNLTRPQGLQLLQSLRYGLPPSEAVEYLTVGYSNAAPLIERMLCSTKSDDSRWIMIKGNYGEGKSHFLRFFRNYAHSLGYASCYLCADAGTSALNHPQRFLSTMLSTLELPNTFILGYYGLLMELLLDMNTLQWVHEICSDPEISGRSPFKEVTAILNALMNPERYGIDPEDDFAAALRNHMANHLLGATIVNRPSSVYVREAAYRLLKCASQLVKRVGCRGLVILLDETESIFTKLPTDRSRDGALKVLSALCESPIFDSCFVALAITPDAYGHLVTKVRCGIPSWNRVPRFELADKFSSRVLNGSSVLECPSVGSDDIQTLLERVRDIYFHVHHHNVDHSEPLWNRLVSKLSAGNIPNRLLMRQTVDFLDARRYAANSNDVG